MAERAPARRGRYGICAQLALIAIGSTLPLAPPAEGVMLIAPLLPGDPGAGVRWATAAGALLVASGPYSGSYLVKGSRAALLLPALSHGALLLTARFSGCGTIQSEEL
jgi:hypothetical protein